MRRWLPALLMTACASPSPPPRPPVSPTLEAPVVAPSPAPAVAETRTATTPVARGELPWWHDLPAGVYRFEGEPVVLAVGRSRDHHHVAEGYLTAKVTARLGVRKAAEPVAFTGTMPEPRLSDLFVTREQRFFALYRMPVPDGAEVATPPTPLEVPAVLDEAGRHRVGRHVFEGGRHLYLECEVEGPIANPDWGRTRATAWLVDPDK